MPKPSEIITAVAALMNNTSRTLYTNATCLPYFNLALDELQETFELNDIPVTFETSALIPVPANKAKIGFDTTPSLPSDLIEIKQLWESSPNQNQWVPMVKHDFIPHDLQDNTLISQWLIWAWMHGRINLIPANSANDLKIDYVAAMFNTPIVIANIDVNLPFINVKTYLEYKTAALCAMFIAENETRAIALDSLAGTALTRALGIPIKGQQSIITRRRPFRASYKRRGMNY